MTGPRLGIFGGTFDPPHIGHLALAVDVAHELALDRLVLMVANRPWQKVDDRTVSPAETRLAMVEAAVEGLVGVEVGDTEIRRGGDSYTADTLEALHADEPEAELVVVLGADAAAGLPTWERSAEVRERATIAVAARGGEVGPPPAGWTWTVVPVPRLDVSSTAIRARVAEGRPIDVLVPAPVCSIIRARGLYGSGR